MHTYEYPRPSLTADCIIFGLDDTLTELKVLLIQRAKEPYQGCWAFPGGFVDMDEDVETAARRELEEETGLTNVFMEQLYTFSGVDRDPRGRVVSVGYYALAYLRDCKPVAGDDAQQASWFLIDKLPELAFDHTDILDMALAKLRKKIKHDPIVFDMLPEPFSLDDVQHIYETIWGKKLERRSFRKKIADIPGLVETKETELDHRGFPASLYTFDKQAFIESGADFWQWR